MISADCVIFLFWGFMISVFGWLIIIHETTFKETRQRFMFIVMFCVYFFVFLCILLNAKQTVENFRKQSGHCYLTSDYSASKLLGCVTKNEMLAEAKNVWYYGSIVFLYNYFLYSVQQTWT